METLKETSLLKSTSIIIKNSNKNNKYIRKIRDLMILLMNNHTSPLECVSRVNRRLSKDPLLRSSLMNCILSSRVTDIIPKE
jgi:hypothetical protein